MDFNVRHCRKLIGVILDSTLQLLFKKLLLAEFVMISKKNIHSYMQKLLKYFFTGRSLLMRSICSYWGFPGSSAVKNLPTMQETLKTRV